MPAFRTMIAVAVLAAGMRGAVITEAAAAGTATNMAPIPLAEIAVRAASTRARLHTIEGASANDPATERIQQELPTLTPEISTRLDDTTRLLVTSPSPATLHRLADEWQSFRDELSGWQRDLNKREALLEEDLGRLSRMAKRWDLTLDSGQGGKMSQEILDRVAAVAADVKQTLDMVQARQTAVLTLQDQVSEEDERVQQALGMVERARLELLRNLIVRESPPIWDPKTWSHGNQNTVQQGHQSLTQQLQALGAYVERRKDRFGLQAAIFLLIVLVLALAGRSLRSKNREQQGLEHAASIFDVPIAAAIVLTFMLSGWIYPQAPRLLWAIIGAAALIPANLVLRKLMDRRLFPVLDALVVFYLVDQLRIVFAAQEVVSRLLFLAEMFAVAVFVALLHVKARVSAAAGDARFREFMRWGARLGLAVSIVAIAVDVIGCVRLGKFVGHAGLSCAYFALLLYAVLRILEGLFHTSLGLRPMSSLEMVKHHRELLERQTARWLSGVAILLWAVFVLDSVSLRQPLFEDLRGLWMTRLTAGAVSVRIGDVVLFGATVWAAFAFSRVLRFVLAEDVYPRANLAPGLHYSVSTMLHYAILLAGFLIALGLIGFDLTRLTILAGAFSVGLGFGLQNIVNNFVSGIILLFERPIKVGDVVQLASAEGVVQRIGIRASIIRTGSGAEIIVPNGKLISDEVTNWTLSDRHRLISIPVSLTAGTDPTEPMELLKSVAASDPRVLKSPAPRVLLTHFGGGSVGLELRAWTDLSDDWPQTNSDLSLAVRTALLAGNLTPQ